MNRVALVVGVGPGLGAALGRRLARGGFRVALIARGPDFINELARELHSLGQPALPIVADASRPAEIAAAVARTRDELGPVEVLMHNASSSSGDVLLGRSSRKRGGSTPSAHSSPRARPPRTWSRRAKAR